MNPRYRRKPSSPFNKQVLGVAVRIAEREPRPLKLTEFRVKLMRAIDNGEVKAGHGSYIGQWRWQGMTITGKVLQLIHAGWVCQVKQHAELTDAGKLVLPAIEGAS